MKGKVTFSVLSESHVGRAGSDWRYSIEVKVFNQGLQGQDIVKVKKHQLRSGVTQQPPGPPKPIELPAGDCSGKVKIKLRLEATEVDLFKSDSGVTDIDLYLDFPEPGDPPLVHEKDISVGVSDSGRDSVVTFKVRLVLSCE